MARHNVAGPGAATVVVGVVVAAVLGLRLVTRWQTPPPTVDGRGTVVGTVDGDTVVVQLDGSVETVRLIGIDTPESVHPTQPVECFGPEASHHLAELLPPGTPVRLERDIEPRDRYGRLLAYVHRTTDDLFVNEAQVTNGYAEALPYPPNTTLSRTFTTAEATARSSGTGLWSAC